jgi:hypothetical protein
VPAWAPMGGTGSNVEIDETYIGKKRDVEIKPGAATKITFINEIADLCEKAGTNAQKHIVAGLVERGGAARFFYADSTSVEDIIPIAKANIDCETHVMIDESNT